ncbi:hypothetical protein KSS87_019151 [Heliosperma pusillum]|nr:hypothetical protein KSS87_019151 [Heliosperma pusillum]
MDFYDKMKAVVVKVEVYSEEFKMFDCEGAGVFVSPEGDVLTLSHMFNDDPKASIQIVTVDKVTYGCRIKNVNPTLGLALLQVENSDEKKKFSYAMVYEGAVNIGEEIFSIGHSYFLDFSHPIGDISKPHRLYGEVVDYIKVAQDYNSNKAIDSDPGSRFVCHVDNLNTLKLKRSVPLVQANNIHGDGMGGSSGMPFFNSLGYIIGIYLFAAHDQCYGIHARCIRSYLKKHLGDISGLRQRPYFIVLAIANYWHWYILYTAGSSVAHGQLCIHGVCMVETMLAIAATALQILKYANHNEAALSAYQFLCKELVLPINYLHLIFLHNIPPYPPLRNLLERCNQGLSIVLNR